jgi:signal transduction histidine kinase
LRLFDDLSLRDVRSSTTFRLAVVLGALFCCGVVALGALIYGLTTSELTARSDQILRRAADRLLQLPPSSLVTEIPKEVERNVRGLDRFTLLSSDGRFLTGDVPPPPGLRTDNAADVEGHDGFGPMRMLEVRAGNGQVILLGRDISEIRYLERHILIVIVISGLCIIPGVLLIGTVLSFPPLRRVQDLQSMARRVAAGDFALRMPLSRRQDELDRIAVTVNTMISDIGRIIDQVKHVTDAVAHDLRTPLTRVRSRLDDLRAHGDLPQPLLETVQVLIDDLDLVLERFAALLRISELEAREQRSGFQTIQLAPLIRDVFDLYQPLAEDAGIHLVRSDVGDLQIDADRNLLFETLSNLVDNAIKFAATAVSISAWKDGSVTVIKVQDDGPGIPADERDAVLRRFYRRPGKSSRQGSGLGLSVVSAILHLHRFRLELADAHPGLAARIIAGEQQ